MSLLKTIKSIISPAKERNDSHVPLKEHDKNEAHSLLVKEMEIFRQYSYSELQSIIEKEPFCKEVKINSNKWYQIEINVFWDNKKDSDIRVIGSIDDGGFRSFLPLSEDFIMNNQGKFVGE